MDRKGAFAGIRLFCFYCWLGFVFIFSPAGVSGDDGSQATFEIQSFIEMESYVNTRKDQDFSDAVKKNEIRSRSEIKFGSDDLYLFVTPDIYYNPELSNTDGPYDYRYASEQEVANNLRITDTEYEISWNEFYLNYMIHPVRLRVGNQLYKWGTADAINPTSYFNAYDYREFSFRDDDEFKQGAPSVSAMVFADWFTAEFVLAVAHVPTLFAPSGNYWSIDMRNDVYQIIIPAPESLAVEASNAGMGARFSATLLNTDMSLSVYHGPDREPVLVPDTQVFGSNESMIILIDPQYRIVTTMGMDISKSIGDFTINFEGAYTPKKYGFVNQDINELGLDNVHFPFEVRQSEHLAYAGGFNYFIPIRSIFESHTGDMVFTADWYESRYFDDELYGAYLSDLLTFRLQDSFWDGRLNLSFTSIFEMQNGGTIYWPKIEYDFLNGLTIMLAYADIDGEIEDDVVEPLLYHFKDNDFVGLTIRYRL